LVYSTCPFPFRQNRKAPSLHNGAVPDPAIFRRSGGLETSHQFFQKLILRLAGIRVKLWRQAMKEDLDFGGTDGPMSDQQLQVFKAQHGSDMLHLPMAITAFRRSLAVVIQR
jgi:hypothetical protein